MTPVFLHAHQIDFSKWDSLIEQSTGTNFYSFSWYLNETCKNWSALVIGDYEYILPLPTKSKGLFKIAYQPFFSRHCGVISTKPITPEIINLFLSQLPRTYLQFGMGFPYIENINTTGFTSTKYPFQALSLDDDYETLKHNYATNNKRILKKLAASGVIIKTVEPQIVAQLFEKHTANNIQDMSKANLAHLNRLIPVCENKQAGKALGAFSAENELLAAAFFIFHKQSITYLKGASTPAGKNCGAMYGIMDNVIKTYSKKYAEFDFGGSRIESIASFFKKFGATNRYYLFIQKEPSFLIHLGKRIYKKFKGGYGSRIKSI